MIPAIMNVGAFGSGGYPPRPSLNTSLAINSTPSPTDTNIVFAPSADWNMGIAPMTLDGWAWLPLDRGGFAPRLLSLGGWPTCSLGISVEGGQETPSFYFWFFNGSVCTYISFAVPVAVWFHYAIVREGNQIRCYVNGQLVTAATIDASTSVIGNSTDSLIVFSEPGGSNHIDMWISEMRLTKGVPIYLDAGFGISGSPMTASIATSLLLQVDPDDGVVDNSGKNHVSTVPITGLLLAQRGPF